MDDLKPLAVFAETVDAGSMSAAARRLGMSPSAVSQTIRALEQHSSVTLLHRSTRKLALTEAGERYYPHCKRMLEAARAAAEALQQARDVPTGELRVSAPVGFATHIAPALAPLLAEAPQLRLRLLVDDAMIDLIDARIDVAIRVGRLADSSWVARRLCEFDTVLCASPDYLARHGTPTTPQDLPRHQWVAFARETRDTPAREGRDAPTGADPEASITQGGIAMAAPTKGGQNTSHAVLMSLDLRDAEGQIHRTTVEARVASNNQVALQQLCERGLGLGWLVHAEVLPSLERGTLVQVLAPWRLAAVPVWAVTPKRDGEAAKVRAALDHFKRYFAARPGLGLARST